MAEHTIVVGVDFSDASRLALDAAAALAEDLGGTLVVAHALPRPGGRRKDDVQDPIGSVEMELSKDQVDRLYKEWLGPLRKAGGDVRAFIREGRAADVLLAAAEEHDATFVVVGRQGHGRMRRYKLGSVSSQVATRCRRPVLVIPVEAA